MKHFLITALTALTGFMAQAQGQQIRTTGDFSKIEVKNGIEVIVSQGEKTAIRVESDSEAHMGNIITETDGNTLKIYLKDRNFSGENTTNSTMKVYVTQKEFTGFKASSGSIIKINGEVKATGLAVSLASGASFKGKVTCTGSFKLDAGAGSNFDGIIITDFFHGELNYGAVVKLAGIAVNSIINSSGGATCLAANFKCKNARVNARRTSNVVVNVKESITADTDDTASITYYGRPTDIYIGPDSYAIKRN